MCGQALRFVREIRSVDDLPVDDLIDQLMADQHLIMADHTIGHWPDRAVPAVCPSSMRDNRENWMKQGAPDANQRAILDVERRLAAYRAPELDPLVDLELQRIIRSGFVSQTELPMIPPPPEGEVPSSGPGRRINARRRG